MIVGVPSQLVALGSRDGRTDGRVDSGQVDSTRTRELFPVWEHYDSKVSRMWEIATARGVWDQKTRRERGCVTKSSVNAFGTWVPVGCSQGWLLVGRGRWDCPAKVCTILIEGFREGKAPMGCPSLPLPPRKRSTNM